MFPNLRKETDIQIQEPRRALNKMNLWRSTPRHIKITISKVKDMEKIIKAAREKELVT